MGSQTGPCRIASECLEIFSKRVPKASTSRDPSVSHETCLPHNKRGRPRGDSVDKVENVLPTSPCGPFFNPPAPLRGAIRLRRIPSILSPASSVWMKCNCSRDFLYFHSLHPGCGGSWCMSHVSWLMFPGLGSGREPIYSPEIWGDPRNTLKSYQISNHSQGQQKSWKLITSPPKIMKIRPWDHEKSNFCESWFVQYIACHMIGYPIPDIKFRPNNHQKQA